MVKRKFRLPCVIILAVLLALTMLPLFVSMAAAAGEAANDNVIKPLIFVHGFMGSGAQFESQAMRFASNGYPADLIDVFEYDSIDLRYGSQDMNKVLAALDAKIDAVRAATGYDQVYVAGHSMGTTVMHNYLSTPERAARVAKYVNIDGRTADAPPGGVPTLALWAGIGSPERTIVGATNVILPNQAHVQACTSPEAFVEMYKFLAEKEPVTDQILPEAGGKAELGGRAVYFPQNTGVQDATLEIWEVDGATGFRKSDTPQATYPLSGDGSWGPFQGKAGAYYEFNIVKEGVAPHHQYFEPFMRSDYLIRLNTSPPGGIADMLEHSDKHSGLVIIRNKEFLGDQAEGNNDALEIEGQNVINALGCPLSDRVIAIFVYDNQICADRANIYAKIGVNRQGFTLKRIGLYLISECDHFFSI